MGSVSSQAVSVSEHASDHEVVSDVVSAVHEDADHNA